MMEKLWDVSKTELRITFPERLGTVIIIGAFKARAIITTHIPKFLNYFFQTIWNLRKN